MTKAILIIIVLLGTYILQGEEKMDLPLYNLQAENYLSFQPKVYPNPDIYFGYTIPIDNAIATKNVQSLFGSQYNVSIYKFGKNKLIREDVISGDLVNGIFPAFNDRILAVDGHRSIELYDIQKGKYLREMMVCKTLEETVENFGVIDGEKMIGLVEIINLGNDDINKRFLKIFNFSGEKPILLAEKERFYGTSSSGTRRDKWIIYNNLIIVYNYDYIKAYDFKLDETTHPIINAFNKIAQPNFRKMDEMIVHPFLPFAVIVEIDKKGRDNYKVWLLKWDEDPAKCMYKLLIKDRPAENFMLSPDGKWVVFNDSNILNGDITLYTMPVDTTLPHMLGQPVVLGNIGIDYQKSMWTRNPMSFVRIGNEQIYRWEFDKLLQQMTGGKK